MMSQKKSRRELVLVGLSHRTAPIELREQVAFDRARTEQLSRGLLANQIVAEIVVLSTCNRSELYAVQSEACPSDTSALESNFAAIHRLTPDSLNGHLYRHRNGEVARHLYRVVASLDSQFLGEAEIQGQVRDAYLRALSLGMTGPVLNRLFQAALEVGKRVRAETGISTRPVSVAFAGVKLGESIFGDLKGHCALVVGAGAVAEQVVQHLRERGVSRLLVSSRTREHAEKLSQRFGGEIVPWESLSSLLAAPDVIVCSAASSERVVSRAMLEQAMKSRGNRPVFLIDLAIPRNIEPSASELYNVYLYNTDDLNGIVEENRRARAMEVPAVEGIIAQHIGKFEAWQAAAELAATWAGLSQEEKVKLIEARAEQIHPVSLEHRRRWIHQTSALLEAERDVDRSDASGRPGRMRSSMRTLRILFGYGEERS